MTQSDAPNEEREEKLRQECSKALKCLYVAVDESIANDVDNKVSVYIQELRDQLSKERETIKEKDTWISEERRISTELGNKLNDLEQSLSEEREMRKELVDHMSELLSDYKNHCVWLDFEKRTEAILKKSSELGQE